MLGCPIDGIVSAFFIAVTVAFIAGAAVAALIAWVL
jgi:hypothetical protein